MIYMRNERFINRNYNSPKINRKYICDFMGNILEDVCVYCTFEANNFNLIFNNNEYE